MCSLPGLKDSYFLGMCHPCHVEVASVGARGLRSPQGFFVAGTIVLWNQHEGLEKEGMNENPGAFGD